MLLVQCSDHCFGDGDRLQGRYEELEQEVLREMGGREERSLDVARNEERSPDLRGEVAKRIGLSTSDATLALERAYRLSSS